MAAAGLVREVVMFHVETHRSLHSGAVMQAPGAYERVLDGSPILIGVTIDKGKRSERARD